MGKTGVSVKLTLRSEAQQILDSFSWEEKYLRKLVAEYCPNLLPDVDFASYRELKRYGYVIRGVAKRIVSTTPVSRTNLSEGDSFLGQVSGKELLEQRARLPEQLSLFR